MRKRAISGVDNKGAIGDDDVQASNGLVQHTLIGAAFCLPGIAAAQQAVRPPFVDPTVHDGVTPYLVFNNVFRSAPTRR